MWRVSLHRNPPIEFLLVGSKELTMPRGCPPASWLRYVESYLEDTGIAGQRHSERWPDRGRMSSVARWTRRRGASAHALTLDLTWSERGMVAHILSLPLYPRIYIGISSMITDVEPNVKNSPPSLNLGYVIRAQSAVASGRKRKSEAVIELR